MPKGTFSRVKWYFARGVSVKAGWVSAGEELSTVSDT